MVLKQRKVRPVEVLVWPAVFRILEETSAFELLVSADIFLPSDSLSVPVGNFCLFSKVEKCSFVPYESICAPVIFCCVFLNFTHFSKTTVFTSSLEHL